MRNVIKNLIKIGLIAVFFTTPIAFLPLLAIGYVALKAVDIVGNLVGMARSRQMSAAADISEEERQRRVALHKENTNKQFYDVKKGQWNVRDLPLDMYPTHINDMVSYFTCAGIDNLVEGRVLDKKGKKVSFSFLTDSAEKAQRISDWVHEKGILGMSVTRDESGKFRIESDNAIDINNAAKEFYPPRVFEVEREIKTTRQYLVSGCNSYKEAEAKLAANQASYTPANVFQTIQDTVNGNVAPAKSSHQLEPTSLEHGTYLVNATTSEVFSKKVTFNGGLDATDEALESEAQAQYDKDGIQRANELVESKCQNTPVFTEAIPYASCSRFVSVNGEEMKLRDYNIEDFGASINFRFSSQEEMLAVVRGERSLKESLALVDVNQLQAKDGEYVLTVPVTSALVDSLSIESKVPSELYEKYQDLGISMEDCELTYLVHQLKNQGGHSTVRLNEEVDFSDALVNGVPLKEFQARKEDKVMGPFQSAEEERKWLKDAALIHSVDIQVDLKNQKMTVTSVVNDGGNNVTKIESRKLDDEETFALSQRGKFTDSEMKDLLIKMHPDFFVSYSDGNKSVFADPVAAFIRNEKPKTVAQVLSEQKAQKQEVRQEVKQAKVQKKLHNNSMKL